MSEEKCPDCGGDLRIYDGEYDTRYECKDIACGFVARSDAEFELAENGMAASQTIIALRAEVERLTTVAQHQEDLLNAILQPGEWWLELRRGYKGAGENGMEWLAEHGESYGLAEQRVIEAIRAALKEMVKG